MGFGFMTIGTQRTPITAMWIEGGELAVKAELHGPLKLPAAVTLAGDDGVPIGEPLTITFTDDLTGQPLPDLAARATMSARIWLSFRELTAKAKVA